MDFNSLNWIVARDIAILVCLILILLLLIKLCCKHCTENSDKFRRRFRAMSQNASTQQLDRLLEQPEDIVYQRATTNAGQISESDDDY